MWQTHVDVPVQLTVAVAVSPFDVTVVVPLLAVQVGAPKQERGLVSVPAYASCQFVAVYVPSALKVRTPVSVPRGPLSTDQPDSRFPASTSSHAPTKLHVPTTSPPHGCTCRQLAGAACPPPPHPTIGSAPSAMHAQSPIRLAMP